MAGTFHNGEIYKRLRKARKLTQAELGAKIGISESTLRRIEVGGKKHRREHEDWVAEALGTTVNQVETEVAQINQAVTRVNDGALDHTADTEPSPTKVPPGMRGDNVLVFPTEPRELKPSLTVWLQPPDWRVVKRVHAAWSTPLIIDGYYVGQANTSFWPAQSETAIAIGRLMTKAWNGTQTETYYRLDHKGAILWRRGEFVRDGDLVRHDIYDVLAPLAGTPSAPIDVDQKNEHQKRKPASS